MFFRRLTLLNSLFSSAGKALPSSFVASIPIFGLVLFLALTEPVSQADTTAWPHHLNQVVWTAASKTPLIKEPVSRDLVQHVSGVSALASTSVHPISAHIPEISAKEAGQAFMKAARSRLSIGLQRDYVTADGHHLILKIVAQDLVTDETISNTHKMLEIAPASTARIVRFVVGSWRYSVEINNRDDKPRSVVQESL